MPAVESPMQGTVVTVDVTSGDHVHEGQQLLVLESMKMEHVISADRSGVVRSIEVTVGQTVLPGDDLLQLDEAEVAAPVPATGEGSASTDRHDLAEVVE